MIIRKMTPSDVPQVAAIEAQCFTLPWSAQGFLDSISREDTIFLVAEIDEEEMGMDGLDAEMAIRENAEEACRTLQVTSATIAGYIGMYTSFGEGEITNVVVSPNYRGRGIGKVLITAMQAAGREQKLESIVLEVRTSNEAALSLYKGNGFKELGIRKNFYEMPTEDAIIMSCELA